MSTTEATPTNVAIITNNETYRVYVKLDADGKIIAKEIKFVTAGKDNATWDALDKDTNYTLALEQTVREYKATSLEAIKTLVPDEAELVNIFNAGANAKTDRKVKAELTALTDDEKNLLFEPVEVFDSLDLLQSETQKKNLTPVEKAGRSIKVAVKAMYPTLNDDEIEVKVRELLSAMGS